MEGKVKSPGYYIQRIYLKSGLSLEKLAYRLDMGLEYLQDILRDNQKLTVEDCIKLSNLFGSSVGYWLDLQYEYDKSKIDLFVKEKFETEKEILELIDYDYFVEKYGLQKKSRIDEKISSLTEFLNISSLKVLLHYPFENTSLIDSESKKIIEMNVNYLAKNRVK